MKQVQSVKPVKAAEYEKAMPQLQFEFQGDTLKKVSIDTPLGPLQLTVGSYSVELQEPATRKVLRVTILDSRKQFPDVVKDFTESYSRDNFIGTFDSCDERFSLALTEFEEPAL